MKHFSCKTEILSGPGAISFLGTLKPRRVFLISDPYFVKNGLADRVLKAAGGETSAVFGEIAPDPSAELAAKATASFQKTDPDLLIALGGGSAIDLAKAVAYFSGTKAAFAAIPTTSGSGSEVTDFAILTHEGVKQPLVDPSLKPDYAILDPELLKTLPKSLIADAGFDVISHALEAAGAKNAGEMSDLFAKEAFRLAYENLPASYAGDLRAREPVHLASSMAGMAFTQAGLGLCHGVSHSLGGLTHVPHGRLNAIVLPWVLEINRKSVLGKYAELWRFAGGSGSADTVAFRNLQNGLLRLRKQLGLPENLYQAGVAPETVRRNMDGLVSSILADPCCGSNPVPVTGEILRKLLDQVTGCG